MGAIVIQCFVTVLLSALSFMAAVGVVWPSYSLRMLSAAESPLGYPITKNDGNLIGSVLMLGSLAAVIVVGYINEKIGRRRTEILAGLFFTLAWAIITTAKSVTQIIIGRFLIGFGGGMQLVTNVIFLGEISQTALRGSLLATLAFVFNVGVLTSYVQGWFCTYEMINYINLTIGVCVVILLCFLKETPQYLIKNGFEKEALNSLMFYRGTKTVNQDILDELAYIRSQQQASDTFDSSSSDKKIDYERLKLNENDIIDKNLKQNPWKILFTTKSSQRALIVLTTHTTLTVYMGMSGIQTYAGLLFNRVVHDISPDLCSVVLAVVLTMSGAISVFVTDLIPRRVLMITTTSISAVCMALLASMLRWSWAQEWAIPLMIITFCFFFQMGPANVTYVQLGECISPQLQSIGSPIVMCNMLISSFIVLYLFEPAVHVLGLDGVFCFFSTTNTLMVIVAYLLMRETKKEPFENVQRMFEQGYIYRRIKI